MTDWQRGVQAFHEGRMREAADRLRVAERENEMTVSQQARYETYAYLGAALYALGLPAEALQSFEQAVQFTPAAAPPDDLLMNLTHAYLAAGRRGAARETLRFVLARTPGHIAAGMLATRLDDAPAGTTVSGTVLGASPASAESYIRTLAFSQPFPSTYAAAEVQEALSQLQRFIVTLSHELRDAEIRNAQNEREILRYRQMEDAVVENMIHSQLPSDESSGEDKGTLSPIEILFRQKS